MYTACGFFIYFSCQQQLEKFILTQNQKDKSSQIEDTLEDLEENIMIFETITENISPDKKQAQ